MFSRRDRCMCLCACVCICKCWPLNWFPLHKQILFLLHRWIRSFFFSRHLRLWCACCVPVIIEVTKTEIINISILICIGLKEKRSIEQNSTRISAICVKLTEKKFERCGTWVGYHHVALSACSDKSVNVNFFVFEWKGGKDHFIRVHNAHAIQITDGYWISVWKCDHQTNKKINASILKNFKKWIVFNSSFNS